MVTRRKSLWKPLPAREARLRARRIRLVLTDVDGVLTDTGIYYSANGEELYRFSRRDGMGFDLLHAAGIEAGVMTSEPSPIIRRRAEKLALRQVHLGVRDKAAHLERILAQSDLAPDQIAYIGDDVNDLAVIRAVGVKGLTGAPGDAVPEVLRSVHYRCTAAGGNGAFREFAAWILSMRA